MRRSALASLAVAALASGAAAAPASAAVERPFDLYTSKVKTKGQAHAWGTVTFLRKGAVRITGKLNDVCPADGYGAYVRFYDGDPELGGDWLLSREDTRTCKASTGLSFALTYRPTAAYRKVDQVFMKLVEYDQLNPPNGAWLRGDEKTFLMTRR